MITPRLKPFGFCDLSTSMITPRLKPFGFGDLSISDLGIICFSGLSVSIMIELLTTFGLIGSLDHFLSLVDVGIPWGCAAALWGGNGPAWPARGYIGTDKLMTGCDCMVIHVMTPSRGGRYSPPG
jgi:hypothetical protein